MCLPVRAGMVESIITSDNHRIERRNYVHTNTWQQNVH